MEETGNEQTFEVVARRDVNRLLALVLSLQVVHDGALGSEDAEVVNEIEERWRTPANAENVTPARTAVPYPDKALVERAVRNARPRKPGKSPRWAAVRDAFGLGSTYSINLCTAHNVAAFEEVSGPECETCAESREETATAPHVSEAMIMSALGCSWTGERYDYGQVAKQINSALSTAQPGVLPASRPYRINPAVRCLFRRDDGWRCVLVPGHAGDHRMPDLAPAETLKAFNYKFLPLNDALQVMVFPVLVEMLRSAAEGRCMVCGWPLAQTVHRGCVPGNCSFRPDQSSREYARWRQRTEIVLYAMAGEVTNPAPRDPAGDCAREFAEATGAPARTGEPGSAQWAGAEEKSSNAEDVRNAATGEL